MSDFQVVVLFVIFIMILAAQIMSSFQNWQIRHMKELRKIQTNKKEKIDIKSKGLNLIAEELKQRTLVNRAVKETLSFSKNDKNDDYQKFTVYDTTTGKVVDYYKKNES
jgi:predicted small secreted protein